MPIRPAQTAAEDLRRWERRRRWTGEKIRSLRKSLEMSQEALALAAGMSRNTLIGIESGRKSIAYERLWDIAEALGVAITDIVEERECDRN